MKKSIDSTYKNYGRILGFGSGPDADWRVMFVVFLILFLVSVLLSFSLYKSTRSGYESEEVSVDLPVDKEALRSTANFYTEKKLNFEAIRTTPETVSDPSI